MKDDPREPALENVLALVIDLVMMQLRTNQPARVTSYDETKQTVSVQPLVQVAHIGEDGKRISKALPEMHDVPVMFLGGANGRITVPIEVGLIGTVFWSSASLARWKVSSGAKVVDPGDDGRNPEDAFFFPGGHAAAPPTSAPTEAIVTHGDTRLGGPGATLAVTRTSDVQTALIGALTDASVLDAIYTYQTTPAGPGKAVALAAVVTAVNAHFVASPVTGAEKVTAE